MSDELWKRVRDIVERSLELEPDQVRAYLDGACGDDAELRAEVERVLAHEGTGDPEFLEPPTPPDRPVPKHVLGEFELLRELGRGGMGVVYLARQARLRREVAVKVLVEGPGRTEREVERFHREARASGSLRHPGIVQVFADGQAENTHWFAMEYVEGHDLHRELALQRSGEVLQSDRPFLPRPGELDHAATIARVCADVADALQHAHEHGLVHRDVKPQNLLLQPDGRVQIADFGLVRDESLGSITQTGVVAGTPHYMSPEQAQVSSLKVDHRTDVYSLGVVLYELATLKRPFEGKTSADVITKIRDTDPRTLRAWNPRLPRDLETICLKAMQKDPRARYATAGELRDDLRRFLRHEAILAKPPSLAARSRRWLRKHRIAVAGTALVLTAAWLGARVAESLARARATGELRITAHDERGSAVPGVAALMLLDPVTGVPVDERELGRLPLDESGVEPGYYRVVLDLEGWGRRVFSREVAAAETLDVAAVVGPQQRGHDGMVFIEGGTLALREDDIKPLVLNNLDVAIPDLWIDATEVSNAEYDRFLRATDHPAPPHWAKLGPEHDDLPVTKISWYDARAYAEWMGKHLPSFAEWTWVARGAENRVYPWEGAVRGELRGNTQHPRLEGVNMPFEEQYFAFAAPVTSHPDARTPEQVYNMFGNVCEFTETSPADFGKQGPYTRGADRIAAGHAWDGGTVGHTLATFYWLGKERTSAEFRVGFRCARSTATLD